MLNIAIDAGSVRPIPLDCHRSKAFFRNQPLRNTGPLMVKLVRTMGCLAQQNKARIANQGQKLVVIMRLPRQRNSDLL